MGRANDFLNGFTRDEIYENGQGTQLAIDETKQPEETVQPVANNVQSQGYNMTDFYKSINPNPELTPEQQAKMARRERASKAIAALGDVGTAMANIWTTRNGATPIEQNPTLSNVEANRWEKWKQEHKQKVDQYRQGLGQARQLDVTNILADRKQKIAESKEERLRQSAQINDDLRYARQSLVEAQTQAVKAQQENNLALAALHNANAAKIRDEIKDLETNRERVQKGLAPINFKGGSSGSGRSSGGTSSSKKTFTVGGVTYDDANSAVVHIPESEQRDIARSLEKNGVQVSNETIVREYEKRHSQKKTIKGF